MRAELCGQINWISRDLCLPCGCWHRNCQNPLLSCKPASCINTLSKSILFQEGVVDGDDIDRVRYPEHSMPHLLSCQEFQPLMLPKK